jgi:hypothetical protein
MASLTIGPVDRNPDIARGEHSYAHLIGAQTAVLSSGSGFVHTVVVGAIGTLAAFYDTPPGGTTDASTLVCMVSLAALTVGPLILDVAFGKGITVVVTGGAGADLTISFDGPQTVSSRTFP